MDIISQNPNCAIFPWNKDGITLESAIPGLEQLTCGRSEWKAVLVLDSDTMGFDYINKRNPFDTVESTNQFASFNETQIFLDMKQYYDLEEMLSQAKSESDVRAEKIDAIEQQLQELRAEIERKIADSSEKIKEYQRTKKEKYQTAATQPITQLAMWMSGPPIDRMPERSKNWPERMIAEDHEIDWDYYRTLYSLNLYPSEFERYHSDCTKYKVLSENFLTSSVLTRRPTQIIALSERYALRADDIFQEVAIPHEDLEYAAFCDDNLYPSSMRYLLCDVKYENNQRIPFSFLEFSSLIFMLATNDTPYGTMREGRVYNGSVQIDRIKARRFFTHYFLKLNATKRLLTRKLEGLRSVTVTDAALSPEEAYELFESDANIPVKIRVNANRAEYTDDAKIGLSRDCPTDEYNHWYSFVTEATRKFVRYLREPRRAVKNSAKTEFRQQSVIEDDRIMLLDEDRLEDIRYRLQEEEFKMVKTSTNRLFKSKEYLNRIEDADKVVRNGIFKRMTRKRVLITSLSALAAFLFGFIPLIIRNNKDSKSFLTTLIITGASLGLMAVVGLVFLFVVRYKQKQRIKRFNNTVNDIFDEIENGLQAFSRYLSHACNVMRAFSIFNFVRKPREREQDIVKKHLCDVQLKIDGINGLFVSAAEADEKSDVLPYNYDFSQLKDYVYDVPYEAIDTFVRFISRDNLVSVPIDYIVAVDLTMEELYDGTNS